MARRGLQDQRPREASSDASLWEDLDDPIDAFAGISTPPLPPTDAADRPDVMLDTASNPITITDGNADSSSLQQGLEHELFPSGRPQAPSSSSASRSRPPDPPSSFELDPARLSDPTSQKDLKATQYLREEWLISAGQKEPDDLVENYIPVMRRARPETITVATAKRGRSSLLDQIDSICSPASSGSSIQVGAIPTIAREPLRPSKSAKANGKARATADEIDQMAAAEMLNMSCSPPSQSISRIKSITDMSPEEQQFYHRLAFSGSSSSSSPSNMGVTARGKNGKTWQTTWNETDSASKSSDRLATTSRPSIASGSNTGRGGAKGATTSASTGSTRGRKPSAFTVGAQKGSRGGKCRSSSASSSSASRSRSRFFASRGARGGRRGRGR